MAVPTVLVVDDDDSVREITVLALEVVAGWRVIAAGGGAEALELARTHQPGRRAARRDDAGDGRPDDAAPPAGRRRRPATSRSSCSPPRC